MGIADGWNFKGGSSGLRAADPCGLEQRARDGSRRCARLFEAAARADACMGRLPLRDRTEGTHFTHDPSPGTKPAEESHDADATCGPSPAEASARRSLRDRIVRHLLSGRNQSNRPQPSGGGIGRDARCSPPPRRRLRAADLCEVETVRPAHPPSSSRAPNAGRSLRSARMTRTRAAGLRRRKLRPADPCGTESDATDRHDARQSPARRSLRDRVRRDRPTRRTAKSGPPIPAGPSPARQTDTTPGKALPDDPCRNRAGRPPT